MPNRTMETDKLRKCITLEIQPAEKACFKTS